MKKPCETCGGSGQINFFKGVSRFLLSMEECPECGGLGFTFSPEGSPEKEYKQEKPMTDDPTRLAEEAIELELKDSGNFPKTEPRRQRPFPQDHGIHGKKRDQLS